ncbi:hypothetical protein AB835_12205 [Candidatus Endobugula sertula]|uniref:Thymidine phosphorylase n=1 Tax=Candidatus Endobugula sertula TaxID=62101 RepID=A0A1D2QMH6_9GAMM|nr:hypothetical protein AB835_12205 [Candidatus Endobugula sertula]
MKDIEKILNQCIDDASNNQLHMEAFENARIFSKGMKQVKKSFNQHIAHGFEQFKEKQLATHVKENEFHNESWALVDDSILEETIVINTLSSQATVEYQEKLWQLNQRLTIVNNETTVEESNNPLSPIQFYVALRNALQLLRMQHQAKQLCYKSLSTIIDQFYPTIINKANALFIHEGILPDLRYETSADRPPGKYSSHNKDNETISHQNNGGEKEPANISSPVEDSHSTTNAEPHSQRSLVSSIRNLLKRARNVSNKDDYTPIVKSAEEHSHSRKQNPPQGSDGSDLEQEPVIFSNESIVSAVETIQQSAATAHFFSAKAMDEVLHTPTNITENSAQVYDQLYKKSPNGAINAQNMYTIDMVGMLFEYILSDENLPDSIKTLLSHLHTPFLKLAFIDSRFFEDKNHQSRLLLDSLAEAGTNWVDHDGTAQYDMYNEIKRVVQRAVKEFKNDVGLFEQLLAEFNLLKKRVSHMHNLRERNSIEKKQGQEKHEQAKQLASQEIKNRIEGRRAPSAIIGLLSPWFTYLTFIYLREGHASDQWNKALRVIDNLLVYSSIKKIKQDATQLTNEFNQLIRLIDEGLTIIAYNTNKAAAIMEELEELKQSVLNKQAVKTTLTPIDKQPEDADNTPLENAVATEEEKVMNYIKLIEPGTWIEHDNQFRLKVNGYNADIGKYVLIDQNSQKVVMLSRLEFAREILSGTKKIVDGSAKPLFVRALERIHNNLNKQVKASAH